MLKSHIIRARWKTSQPYSHMNWWLTADLISRAGNHLFNKHTNAHTWSLGWLLAATSISMAWCPPKSWSVSYKGNRSLQWWLSISILSSTVSAMFSHGEPAELPTTTCLTTLKDICGFSYIRNEKHQKEMHGVSRMPWNNWIKFIAPNGWFIQSDILPT